MINILSYVGMNMQSEVCLWCLLGLVRTIFDATLFKVNANLKQVWQMTMPEELTMPVQRVLRTMVSGVMLVQCFTVYVYLASYIVLLYPVFLEERPTLVLPWLLLAAIRKLLCELTSLALGLGTCVLLGPARPPCIKFVVVKFSSIMPAFYMWMLVFSYYHALKVATAFKTFPAVLPPNDNDYGLELAVRRRRTKSLLGEEQLRKKLVAHFYGERSSSITNETFLRPPLEISSRMIHSTDTSIAEEVPESDAMKPLTMSTTGWSDIGAYEDWFGSEVMIPRDTDRILEQIVLMLLRIGAYLKKEGIESILDSQKLNSAVPASWHQCDNIDCAAMNADDTETPPLVGSSKGNMASYLREYPQIFMKKLGPDNPQTERTIASLKTVHSHGETDEGIISRNKVKRISSSTSSETTSFEFEKVPSKRKITISDNNTTEEDKIIEQKWPSQLQTTQIANVEGKKNKSRLRKQRDSERQSKSNDNEITNTVKNNFHETNISTEDTKRQTADSKISTVDSNIKNKPVANSNTCKTTMENSNKEIAHSETTNIDEYKDEPKIGPILDVNTNERLATEFQYNESFNDDCINEVTRSKMLEDEKSKGLTNSLLSNDDRSKELPGVKISDVDNMLIGSKNLNIDKNKDKTCKIENLDELTQNQTGEKNIELSFRKLSIHDNTIDSLDVKLSVKNIERESKHSVTLNKGNNELTQKEISTNDKETELTTSKVSNVGKNKVSTDIQISDEANNENSTGSKTLSEDKSKDSTEAIPECNSNDENVANNSKKSKL